MPRDRTGGLILSEWHVAHWSDSTGDTALTVFWQSWWNIKQNLISEASAGFVVDQICSDWIQSFRERKREALLSLLFHHHGFISHTISVDVNIFMVIVVNNIPAGRVIHWMVDFSAAVNMLKLFWKTPEESARLSSPGERKHWSCVQIPKIICVYIPTLTRTSSGHASQRQMQK